MRSAFGLRELPYAVAFGSGLLLGLFEASEVSRRAAAIAYFFSERVDAEHRRLSDDGARQQDL